jgi:heme/copper-type cytochrome/quinol oxidase subunit 3
MEASSASAPSAAHLEPEPREWQPRALWFGARLLCGAATFFFASFLFAYFYLRSLDNNDSWKDGSVHPSAGLGLAITALLVLSAVVLRLGASRPTDTLGAGIAALLMALLAIILQVVEYTTLGFGPASGGYASVFLGWTAFYALFALGCVYWIETQMVSLWRARREGVDRPVRAGVPAHDDDLIRAGIEACSFFWAFYVAIGVVAAIVLYLV